MSRLERLHCQFCNQDYISSTVDKCTLCGKSGGILHSPLLSPQEIIGRPVSTPAHLSPTPSEFEPGKFISKHLQKFAQSRWLPGLALFAVVCKLAVFFGEDRSPSRTQPTVQTGHYQIAVGNSKPLSVKIQEGDFLELSVNVESGDPISLHVAKSLESEENKLLLKGVSEFPPAVQVMDYHRKEKWLYPTAALIFITTKGTANISFRAEVSPPLN
jgi:hypothetical protein